MARDGNGKYNIPTNSWYPPVNGNQATAADFKKLIEDVADSLTQSVSSDGQTAMQGSLNMGGNRVRSLGAPQGNNDALRRLQLMKGPDITPQTVATIPDEGSLFEMNGKGTVQSFSASFPGRQVWIRFSDEITLKNSTVLQLPNNEDWATKNGQLGLFLQTNDGNWMCVGRWPVVIPTGTAADANLVTNETDITAGRVPAVGWMGFGLGGVAPNWSANPQALPYTGFIGQYGPNSSPPSPINSTYGQYIEFGSLQWRSRLVHSHTGNRLWHAWSTNSGAWSFDEIWTSRSFNPATKANTNQAVSAFTGNFPWNRIDGKPTTMPPSAHTHPWSQITGAPAIPPTQQSLGYTAVGQLAFVSSYYSDTTDSTFSAGDTRAGSRLTPTILQFSIGSVYNKSKIELVPTSGTSLPTLPGTWRLLSSSSRTETARTFALAIRIS